MINKYEEMLINNLKEELNFDYCDIAYLDKYPLSVSKKVLQILIENACLGQNLCPIELGRKKINEINKEWLKKHFMEVASLAINFDDEWEFRRLGELVIITIPELKQQVLDMGKYSYNEEVREAVEDLKDFVGFS